MPASILALGADAVSRVAALAGGQSPAMPAVFALHALALYAGRGGGRSDRKVFAEGIARQLAAEHPTHVKAMFIGQLQLALATDATATLSGFLADEALGSAAARALVSFGTAEAKTAIRAALPRAKRNCRLSLVLAAGELRDTQAAAELLNSVENGDRETRLGALWALANSGQPSVDPFLARAMKADSLYESSQAADGCLLLAERLRESGDTARAAAIYKRLAAAENPAHVRQAAVRGLLSVAGDKGREP